MDTKPVTIKQMFEAKWNYLPSANDQFNFLSVDTMTKYENVITSEGYLKSLRSGIKGKLHIKRFNFSLAYLVNNFFVRLSKRKADCIWLQERHSWRYKLTREPAHK
jgi:hypothetical protein